MPQSRINLFFTFIVFFFFTIALASSFPIRPIFIPLACSFYFLTGATCGFLALCFGLFFDVIFISPFLGFFGGAYLLSSLILQPVRTYFFKDRFSTCALVTFFFSFSAYLFERLFLFLFDIPHFTLAKNSLFDFLAIPAADSIVALFFYSLPILIWQKMKRTRSEESEQ